MNSLSCGASASTSGRCEAGTQQAGYRLRAHTPPSAAAAAAAVATPRQQIGRLAVGSIRGLALARSTGRAQQCATSSSRSSRQRQQLRPAAAAAGHDAAAGVGDNLPQPVAASSRSSGGGLSSLGKRAVFGTILGLGGAVVIVAGGWLYGLVACLAAYQCSQEYIGLMNAKGISSGMKVPPPVINSAISLLCVALNAWVFMTNGRAASAMAVATFFVLSLQLLAVKKPRFTQLTTAVFGLLYCGYLPSFWIKLRLMAIPAVHSGALATRFPTLLGGLTHTTVGLLATFTAVACIIAADTGAYFFGKAFGRTQLSSVSPKKTVEGAAGGLLCSVAVALGCCSASAWPASPWSAAALGTIVFFASLFGDLIESVIKRDAGLKDASNLIPGHGGLLDRLDSYLFTGACVYFFLKFCVAGCGV